MRVAALITIMTLGAGGLVAVACGGTEETVNNTPADAGREGGGSSSGGGDGGGSSSGDAGDGGNNNTGPCNTLAQAGANVNAVGSAATQPTGTGGTVEDGTYVLVSARATTPIAINQSLGAITIKIEGTSAQAVTTNQAGTETDTHSGSFTTTGTNFTLASTCSTAGADALNFTGTYTIGSDAGTAHLSIHITYDSPIGPIPATADFAKQ